MLERVAAWFLNTYVAEYVGNLNTDQLSIGLLSGAVELEKLTLKKDALRKLKLPIEVKAGYIGKLRLVVPVRHIKSQPWVVEVDQLYIIAGPPDLSKFDPEEEKEAAQARKISKLAAMEQKWREEQQQKGKSTWFWSSFATSFSSSIAENLQVTINDIHVRYEDPEVTEGKSLVIGLLIDQITAQSTNENWEPQFSVGTDNSHKAVDIKGVNVYWDTELLGDLEGSELLESMRHKMSTVSSTTDMMSSSMFYGQSPCIQHLLKPFSASAQITRNCSKKPLKIADGPRVNINVTVEEVPIVVSENQAQELIKLSELFQLRWRSQKYRNLRPITSIHQSPGVWWQFAIRCVVKDIREANERLSIPFILSRARQCVSYVSAYTTHLINATPTTEVKETLQSVEEMMDYEEIVILRRLAMQRVEKERALAEEARRVATAEVEQQGVIQRWFPGWISGYSQEDSEGGGTERTSNSPLEEVNEDELMDELGLETDAYSQLLKDRIFAVVSFSLRKGSLNLVTEDSSSCLGPESIVELELSGLCGHIDYRPRLKYSFYELRLNGLYVEDNYHDNSVFTTLVKPKVKPSNSAPSDDLLVMRLTQQNRPPVGLGYNIHVVTRPLDVIFNKTTMLRLKRFFDFSSVRSELSRGKSKVGGAMEEINSKLLDSISIKLDISAPHIIIPEKFDDIHSPRIVIDLGHLDFESVGDFSSSTSTSGIDTLPLQQSLYQVDEDTFLDVDDDEEFVTPPSSLPSSPPFESEEGADPSTPVQPSLLKEALTNTTHSPHSNPFNKYLLKLSEFQLLVGKLHGLADEDEAAIARLRLLDKFSLLVKIHRNAKATSDTPYILIEANLPLLNFHVDEEKVTTLLTCFSSPETTEISSDVIGPYESVLECSTDHHKPSELFKSTIATGSLSNSTSIYHSAHNVFDKPSGLKKNSSVDARCPQRSNSGSYPDTRCIKLVEGKLSMDHFLMDLSTGDVCLAELRVLGVKGGFVKRLHDASLRVIVQELFLVDKLQQHHPQYELILSSNATSLFTDSKHYHQSEDTADNDDCDIFKFEGDFFLNILFNQYSYLSPNYPQNSSAPDGSVIRNLLVQCTSINAIANQEFIVKFIGFCRKVATPFEKFVKTPTSPTVPVASSSTSNSLTATPIISQLSVEFEKLCVKLLRQSDPFGTGTGSEQTKGGCPFVLSAAIDLDGLGIEAEVGNEIVIKGHLEGAMVRDLTQEGQTYSLVVSVGKCRDGRNTDMITTMVTSLNSLLQPSEVISFELKRVTRRKATSSAIVHDVIVSAHIPSILYTHSVNFIREMEIFFLEFKQYIATLSTSVKSAAIEVAKGLVSDESHLVLGLNRLSSSLGGPLAQQREMEEMDLPTKENEDVDFNAFGDVDRVMVDILVMSPVIVVPSSRTSLDTIVAHLGEISIKNSYISLPEDKQSTIVRDCSLSSSEVERLIVKISNMGLNASHDVASLDWLKQDCTEGICAGRWSQILKETSFELVIERAVGGLTRCSISEGNHANISRSPPLNANINRGSPLDDEDSNSDDSCTNEPEPTVVDVSISCSLPNSLFVSLSKNVFDQIKYTAKHGIYTPLAQTVKTASNNSSSSKGDKRPGNKKDDLSSLPRIIACFSLPQLSIEFSHNIGDEEKKIVFVSFEEFQMRCHTTKPHYTYFDLGLKTVIIEDLLQKKDIFRYILSSTQKPLPFASPVSTPSVFPHSIGISPNPFLSLSHLISSPKPHPNITSPLRSFNPYSSTTSSNPDDDTTFATMETTTTPPNEPSSSLSDIQDLVSISIHHVAESAPDFVTKYKSISFHADVAFSTVYLVVNLQTWVLFFDYLGIGVPTPPSSPTPYDSNKPFFQSEPEDTRQAQTGEDEPDIYSLKPDGSILIQHSVSPPATEKPSDDSEDPKESSNDTSPKSTVWGIEGKLSARVHLKVHSLTVTLNKSEHPLARGVASGLEANATLEHSNVSVQGSLGQASLIDLTDTGAYYRERFTTTGDEALSFDVFKFGQKDPLLERPYDISASVKLSAVRYLHTMRFLKEVIAFLTHFPQLIDAFQRMKAAERGDLQYTPDRKPRILLEVEANGPMILIPKHAFSPEIMGGIIQKLTLCNQFLWDGQEGTLSKLRKLEKKTSRFTYTNEMSSTGSSISQRYSSVPDKLSSVKKSIPRSPLSYTSLNTHQGSKVTEDLKIMSEVAAKSGPCLLDCMELVLSDVDVFSAKKLGINHQALNRDGWAFQISRDSGKLLKEKGTLKLQIERNLYEDFCRNVPDIHIDGTLSAVHLMLDKRQLEAIKGLIDMNLGEEMEEFEKPSSVIQDPVAQHAVAAAWTAFRFHIEFVGVQLEFLQSRSKSANIGVDQSLVLFDIQLSQFTFEAHSNQTKNVDFTTQAVIGKDNRYEGYALDAKPNVFDEVLKYNPSGNGLKRSQDSLQFEIHVFMSPAAIKASIVLNGLRLIGVFDLLLELKKFVIDKLPEDEEEMDHNTSLEEVDSVTLTSLRSNIASQLGNTHRHKDVNKKPERDVTLHLSVTDTDFVVVEDLTNLTSNAVVLKGTVVLTLKSPPKHKGSTTLHCSVDNLELFSCIVSNEDDTALSILDPVSVGVELKPFENNSDNGGTHQLEFDVKQLNVRLSYNDIKLFVAILQSLKAQSLKPDEPKPPNKHPSFAKNEKLMKKLLPLGFARSAILHELSQCGGDVEAAASRLLDESESLTLSNISEEESNGDGMKLAGIMVLLDSVNLCLIDDSLNHDIPLIELTMNAFHANHRLLEGTHGDASVQLSLDYYNRNISAWEPILEPWNIGLNWKKTTGFDLDTNEKPDRLSFGINSSEQMCLNITSTLLHLFKETQASWQSDYESDQRQKGLLLPSSSSSSLKEGSNTSLMQSSSTTAAANVQQGLALLHTVRYISESRQRSKFIPFALRNSTGLPLSYTTLTSLPSEVLVGSHSLMQYSRIAPTTKPSEWTDVKPMEEKPFDFIPHKKMRHKDTRALIVHQLKVKVEGWEETSVPISVDKIGIFVRDLHPSVGSSHGPVRLVFAISLSNTRKIVNIRSGLVLHNTLELPMEIKMVPPPGSRCQPVDLPPINSTSYYAIPLHITHWSIYLRPQDSDLKFCSSPIVWNRNVSRKSTDNIKKCVPLGNTPKPNFYFFAKVDAKPFPPLTLESPLPSPGHTISLYPPLMVSNLLPYDFCFCYSSIKKLISNGRVVPFYTVDPQENIKFSISNLEGFVCSDTCSVSLNDIGILQYLVLIDKKDRKLYLSVRTELVGQSSLKVTIWCSYWIVNRTGLPLVFSAEGDSSGEPTAGQYQEHETASTVTPLLFAYSNGDLIQKCQVCIGRASGEGVPKWSSGFRMMKKSQVIRLFVMRQGGRPDREYQIGMEIHRGSHQYNDTRVVTFVARFQLENRTAFKLGYLQRHALNGSSKDNPHTILPRAITAFHWPRTDLDQLLCIKVMDLDSCYWSGGFPLEHDKSFHINMRRSYGRCVFVRCEVLQRGETYHVIFLDACDYPPPFKLENLSQIQVVCYQSGITSLSPSSTSTNHVLTQLNPGQSVPYSWDDVTLPEKLCIHVKTGSEPKCFDMETVGSKGKVYYESYFYIVAMGTKQTPDNATTEPLVLDVPQGKAVILNKKNTEHRTQLWRMTAEGHLVHVASSSSSTNYVLDLVQPIVKGNYGNIHNTSLMINKANIKKSDSQTWKFTQDGHLVLMNYHFLCVQLPHGYSASSYGMDAVLGRIGTGGRREEFTKEKQSPGSGVLSVAIVQDGPTRILRITDENRKYTYNSIQDDWVIVDNGVVSPVNASDVDPPEYNEMDEEGTGPKTELSFSLSLDKGVGFSLINSQPEELLFASASGIRMEYVSTAVHQCINGTIQYIQVDNQTVGGFSPVLAFPTPSSNEIECNYPVLSCFIERLPHDSPFAIVFRTFEFKLREFTVLMEEKLLFKLLQWAGIGVGGESNEESVQKEMMTKTIHRSPTTSSFPSHQVYIEQLRVSTTNLLVCMHTTSQLPPDLLTIKKRLGFPLIQFESPIALKGFQATHMLGTPVLFIDAIRKHYKHVLEGQAIKILGSFDFLGNPVGLIHDVASGVQGMIALQPDVVGLVRDVTHGMSDTTSKLTGTVSHVLGQATGDSSYLEEREQNLVSCQSSGDHFQAGLINLTGGLFGGVTSIITQPYKGAVEDGLGGFIFGIGKGVVGTVAKPVAGLLDFASGTTAALRESLSRFNRNTPRPVRLRRCCVGATGALTCYSMQLARGEEYLMRLNDGDNNEMLVSYEKIEDGTPEGMRLIISSQALYFFEESPPDPSSLYMAIKLDNLIECRATKGKTTIPYNYITLTVTKVDQHKEQSDSVKKFKCTVEQTARKITQLINYAKNLHEEEKMIVRTPRLQNEVLW